MKRIVLSVAAAVALIAARVPAPPDPAAIEAQAGRYRFDLARNFFPSPAAEAGQRAELARDAGLLARHAGAIGSGAALLRAIETEDEIRRRFRRHDLYHFLRYAVDIREEQGLAAAGELRAAILVARRALGGAILALAPERLASFVREAPGLSRYLFYIETLRREARLTLRPDLEAAVGALEPLAGGGDYPRIVNALAFGEMEIGGRRLDVRRDQNAIAADPSEEVRRDGMRRLFAGYGRERALLAFLLGRTVLTADATARLRGFAGALDQAAFERWIDPEAPERLLAAVRARAHDYRDWQRRTASPETLPMRWLPDEAVRLVTASAAALGPVYRREFAALLSPENGRIDMAGGSNRLPIAGTASVYPTGASAIFLGSYRGVLLDLIILAHEGGHAVQAQLMHRAGVPMTYAAGPGYLTESFGRFQELLLLDHLRRSARNEPDRQRFRDALAWRLYAVFPSAEEAAVELALHRAIREGARTADALDAATAEAGAPYSIDYERVPERRGLWMLSEGYFMAPLHELDDLHASLLAVRYFRLWRENPARFRTRYLSLLSGGYDAEPRTLVSRNLGFDFRAPGFADETMSMLSQEIDALYRE
jgi:oligoendopeptidase F